MTWPGCRPKEALSLPGDGLFGSTSACILPVGTQDPPQARMPKQTRPSLPHLWGNLCKTSGQGEETAEARLRYAVLCRTNENVLVCIMVL